MAGAVLLATATGDELCGITGECITRPAHGQEISGGGFLGAGLLLTAVGVSSTIAGRRKLPHDGPPRRSQGMTTAGVVLSTISALAVGAGLGALSADGSRGELDSTPAPAGITIGIGGAVALTGIVLWAIGSRPAERSAPMLSRSR